MNVEILKRLTYSQLEELQSATIAEMRSRKDFSILPGRTGYFLNNGIKQYCVVERVNPKSVTVKPIGGGRGGWRVSKSLLVMDGIPIVQDKAAKIEAKSEPVNHRYDVETW